MEFTTNAFLHSFRTLADKTYRIQFETRELTPDEVAGLSRLLHSEGALAFVSSGPVPKLIPPEPTSKKGNTPSQMLRFALQKVWENQMSGAIDFQTFYEREMSKIIETQMQRIQ